MTTGATRSDLEELYRSYADELHAFLWRRAGQTGADLLGDVFVVALQRLNDLPAPHLRRAWLYGTARRLLLAQGRAAGRRTRAEVERSRLHDPLSGSAEEGSARAAAVRMALASLREIDRELIRLTEWEQLPVTEAAVVLGLRPGTARMRLLRARRALAGHDALVALLPPTSASADTLEVPKPQCAL
ncbi:RNA polymerase sigma factor [Nocardioides jejuensis]|uniref:RNA polymerase sigma factor n=1 Tax=Nocardioides jejuensis TaxID=2502782 RepID=UPI001404986F|nr:sigma-70 family RNA polymerase sigma factor [Nocardioides jejuensis]